MDEDFQMILDDLFFGVEFSPHQNESNYHD